MKNYTINLDRERNFHYGVKAIGTIEQNLSMNITNLDVSKFTMNDAVMTIWAGLVHEDEELTLNNVFNLVDDATVFVNALEKATEALVASTTQLTA